MTASKSSRFFPKLQSTRDYSMFIPSEFNRDLRGLKKLIAAMREHGYIAAYPIHCVKNAQGKLIIKAGHHRFEAAKSLGIELFYVVSDDEAPIHMFEETTNTWTMGDFVKSYARAGSESHIAILDYAARTGISLGQCASLLSGECACSGNVHARVKNGTLAVHDNEHANKVAMLVCGLRDMGVAFAANAQLVCALSTVAFLDEFDCKLFLHRAATNRHLLIKQSSKNQFLDLIDRVYNHQAKHRCALAFLAREAAKNRCPIKRRTVN